MPWQSLKGLLSKSIKKAGLDAQITGQLVIDKANKILLARWGDKKMSFVEFISFKEGRLKVEISSPVAMQTLSAERTVFINALNHELGKKVVIEIVMRRKGF